MVSLFNSNTNVTRIWRHLREIALRFASGLPPGWPARALPDRSARDQGEGSDRSAELEEISLLTDPLRGDAALQHQLTRTHEVEENAEPLGVPVKEERLRMACLRRRVAASIRVTHLPPGTRIGPHTAHPSGLLLLLLLYSRHRS